MKHLLLSISVACSLMLFSSCGIAQYSSQSNTPSTTPIETTETANTTNLPTLEGYIANTIKFADHKYERTIIELIPGIRQEVDCNKHGLAGTYKEEVTEDGTPYIVFESDGQVFSTRMGCPDNERFDTFVSAPSYFAPYNNEHGVTLYRPASVGLHIKVWQADDELITLEKGLQNLDDTQMKALSTVIDKMNGYDVYAINLSANSELENARIEIVPGIFTAVDCNSHRLVGNMKEATIDGWGYSYYVFESDGEILSTRMGCPETSIRMDFVEGESVQLAPQDLGSYTQVVFVPKDIEVRLRVWRSKTLAQE